MSRYYSFNDYMNDVLECADETCKLRNNCGLEDLYQVSSTTYVAIETLVSEGWYVFIAVTALLVLGPIGLGTAILAFLATPVGLVVAAVLGVGALSIIKQMYRDRILPIAVKAVGVKYKPKWECAEGNRTKVDTLVKEAAEELYNMANISGTRRKRK